MPAPLESTSREADGVSPDDFRGALAHWASGVTIVTAEGPEGPAGMTASAFSSLSLDPPLVLVCIARDSGTHEPLVRAPGFGIHVLRDDQAELSMRFAQPGVARFHGLDYERGHFEVPLLHAGVARLVCCREAVTDGGDHSILIGRVVQVDVRHGEPLLYHRGSYRRLAPQE